MTWGKHAGDVRCCSRWRRQPLSVQRSWTRGRDLSRISTSTNLLCGNVCSVFVLNQTNYCERTRQTTADDGRRTPEDSTLVVFRRRPLSLSLSLSTCCCCWSAGPHRACKAVVVCCCDRGGGGDDPAGPRSCSCCSSLPSCAATTERTQSRFFSPACRRYEKEAPIYYEYFCFFRNFLFSFWSAPSPLIDSSLSCSVIF